MSTGAPQNRICKPSDRIENSANAASSSQGSGAARLAEQITGSRGRGSADGNWFNGPRSPTACGALSQLKLRDSAI